MKIKWVTAWEAKCLKDVEDITALDNMSEFKKILAHHMLEKEYLFSGERHAFGVGVPLFYDGYLPVAKYVCLPGDWARFMYWVWEATFPRESKMMDLRSDFLFPKNLKMKYPF